LGFLYNSCVTILNSIRIIINTKEFKIRFIKKESKMRIFIKNMLYRLGKKSYSALLAMFFVGQMLPAIGVSSAGMAALQKTQNEQAERYGIDARSMGEIQEQTTSDKYTQSEAHLQIKSVRELLAKEAPEKIVPYLDLISDCLVKEQELKDTHYVFYHTTDNVWRVAQDLYTQLYAHFKNPSGQKIDENFTFLRFENQSGPQAKEFLLNELRENGLVDDNGKARVILLSVNLALFGNIESPSECTWEYFLRERKHQEPDLTTYIKIMDAFGLTHKYVEDLAHLAPLFETKEKTLLQIFVPKNIVDEIGYLAWATGIPAHAETINWVRTNLHNKTYKFKNDPETGEPKAAALWAMSDLAETFKKEQEKNPMFKDLIESVKAGEFSLDKYLKIYRNNPWELPGLNYAQARLIFSSNALLNPASGIQFYRHSSATKEQLKNYSEKLNDLVDKIIAEKEGGQNV
jgi:hypothetical protein